MYAITKEAPAYFWFTGQVAGVAASNIIEAIADAINGGASEIHLAINSLGGLVEDAFTVHHIIKACPVPVSAYNTGAIHSAALVVFLAATHRFCCDGSQFLLHPVYCYPSGQLTREMADDIAKRCGAGDDAIDDLIAARAPKFPEKTRKERRYHDVVLTAADAVALGLADEVRTFTLAAGHCISHIPETSPRK